MAGSAPFHLLPLFIRQTRSSSLKHHVLQRPLSLSLHRKTHHHRRPFTTTPLSHQLEQHHQTITPAPPIHLSSSPLPIAGDSKNARLVPASPSYFTTKPATTDDLLHLQSLLRKCQTLPTLPPAQAPRAVWKKLIDYRLSIGEEVPAAKYRRVLKLCARLNLIVPALKPASVTKAINFHKRAIDPLANKRRVDVVDEWGRGLGRGRRKSSRAQVWLVEGEGEVRVNGRGIEDVFSRVVDREAAIWPLLVLGRVGRYNVWAKVRGGGTTGWAEGMAMAVGRALMVHEPGLKAALRRAGVIRRDPRRVERKKPGHVKARKMPTWVKR